MNSSSMEREILAELSEPGDEEQRLVIGLVRSLAKSRIRGVAGKDLLRFAGNIESEDLRAMTEAIIVTAQVDRLKVEGF